MSAGKWEPFRRVREWLAESDLAPTVRHVGLEIGGHLDENGSGFPSLARLKKRTGLGMTAVRASVRALTTGEGRLFDREAGGAREGDRYSCSRYTLRAEGFVARGARETRGSSSEREGFATRARGVRHATTKDQGRTIEGGGAPPLNSRESWLLAARAAWADSVGVPPSWFDADLRPLVTTSRTPEEVLAALRLYLSSVAPDKAGTGDFSRRIGAWMNRGAKAPEREPYRGTPEQLAEKSRQYLEGAA